MVAQQNSSVFKHFKFQVAQTVKNLPANTGDTRDVGSILGPGRFPK